MDKSKNNKRNVLHTAARSMATMLLALSVSTLQAQVTPVSQMEKLDRGLVAVPTSTTANFISWRLLGTDDKAVTTFDLLRDGEVIASDLKKTNYSDSHGTATARYQVVTKVNGQKTETSQEVAPWAKKFLTLKLDRPATGTNGGEYTPNDMSVGDVDGDGQYELFVKWDPSNQHDNSETGVTDKVMIDCYRLDGTKLWRIDLGANIRAGAHYTQFMVYDFDGDGRAEVMMKTAPGTIDGVGEYVNQAATDTAIKGHNNSTKYVNSNGYVLNGPEYLTVFEGLTGKAIHTTWYLPNRAGNFNKSEAWPSNDYWGKKDNGNRADRFLAAVAYLDGPDQLPCGIFSRGYYARAFVWAVSFDGQQLHTKWIHDSETKNYVNLYIGDELTKEPRKAYVKNTAELSAGSKTLYGNGNHNLSIADVDGDGCDEIVWGSGALDNDGRLLYATGFGHGDAIHLGKMIPDRPGYQVFQVHEESTNPYGWDLHDAATGEVLYRDTGNEDNGRGMAADLSPTNRGYEFWSSTERYPRSALTGETAIQKSCSVNFRIYWDGTVQDQLFDSKYNKTTFVSSPYIQKWNGSSFTTVISFGTAEYNNGQSCNTTKCTPNLQADILGDWREELVLWNFDDPSEINIYTTWTPTDHAVPTLMHDHVYRMGICWQNTAYNQPPHLGYFLRDYIDGKLDTGISDMAVERDAAMPTAVYDLQGRRHNGEGRGLLIMRQGDKVKKIFR